MATHNWIAIVDETPVLENGVATIKVTWVNNVEGQKVQRTYTLSSPTLDNFKAQLRSTRDSLENITPFIKVIPVGQIDIDFALPVLTQEQIDKSRLQVGFALSLQVQQLVQIGAIKSDDALVTQLNDVLVKAGQAVIQYVQRDVDNYGS